MNTARQDLFDQLTKFEKTLLQLKRHTLKQLDITMAQAELLMEIGDTRHVAHVAEALGVSSSAATQLIESAEAKELVKRRRSEDDKRSVEVSLTQKGRETMKKLTRIKCDVAKEILQELTDREVEYLATIHHKIIDQIHTKLG